MRKFASYVAMAALIGFVAAGCTTLPKPVSMDTHAVVPGVGEAIIVDDVIIIGDVSGSMSFCEKYTIMKTLVEGFIQTMPDGPYNAGLFTFGGEWEIDWINYPVQAFDRLRLGSIAAQIDHLQGSTFLTEALLKHEDFCLGRTGRTAVVLFSDGKANHPDSVMTALQNLDALHAGTLCVYTVQLCEDEEGGALLRDMAAYTGCGFSTHGESITGPAGMQEFARRIFFGPAPIVTSVHAGPYGAVLFDSGKSVIKPEYAAMLDQVAASAKNDPSVRIQLIGHADTSRGDARVTTISARRAEAVRSALAERGVETTRITVESRGASQPAFSNDDPANQRLNRRVEIQIQH